jgi:hypothetical protein
MSIFAAKPSTTVRQRSPWLPTKTLGLVVFSAVAVVAYGWKYHRLPPPTPAAEASATAKVLIHHPAFASQRVWQEILTQAKADVRDRLKFESRRSGEVTAVSISLSDLPRDSISSLVNMVAATYVQACRSQWKVDVELAYAAAQERLSAARREAQDADSRLDMLRQRQSEAMASAVPKPEPSLEIVENPKWIEAARRLAELEERRRVLLFERTPLHPSVQEIEMHISDMRREMASIPARIAQRPAAEAARPQSLPPAPSPAKLETAHQDVARLHGQLHQVEAAASNALVARSEVLRIDLDPAEALHPIPATSRFGWSLMGTSLFTATTSVVAIGMISFGASLEPALSSVAELQSVLPAPVFGVVPAVHTTRSSARSASTRRLARAFAIASGLLLLVVVAWSFFAV